MWTPEHRRTADRRGLRYPSDLTDAEWTVVAPMIPPAKHGGRRRSVNVREVLNGIFYILWTGCQWKALPKDLPPKSTVHDYLELWNWDGTLERIHHELYVAVREQEGREPSGVCPLHGKLDRQVSLLWPLAEGPVYPGARVPQAELHLHRGELLSTAPGSNASIKVEWLAVHPTLAGQTQA